VYAATKAYVTSFSEALRAELRGTGVSVTALCPGPVDTEFATVARRPDSEMHAPDFLKEPAEKVVRAALRAVARDRARVVPGLAGLLFAASILLMTGHPMIGLTLGIVTSVLLAGKFIPDYMHKRTLVPGGLMALLSAASIGLTLLSWYKK